MKNNLGANIKYFRKNKGYTQEELAGRINCKAGNQFEDDEE